MRRTPLTALLVACLLVTAIVASSCGGGLPSGPPPVANHDSAASSVIGPAGGSVSTSGGATVTIPAGALATQQSITIAPSSSAGPSDATAVGPEYDLGPDGTTFAKTVTMTLAIDPARIPAGKSASDVVVYTHSRGSTDFTRLPTTVVDATHVSATTTHFSGVAPVIDKKPPPPPRGACSGEQYTSDPFDPEPTIKDDGSAAPWAPKDPNVLMQWDPSKTDYCRPKFCNGYPEHTMSPTPWPHPRSRMARYRLDNGCQRHLPPTGGDRLCSKGSGPSLSTVKATACVDIEYLEGPAAASVHTSTEDDVICVQCPDPSVLPVQGGPCEQGQIDLANAHYPIFNVRDSNVQKAEAWFKAGGATKGAAPAIAAARRIAFLNAVRVLAPEIGYCEGTPQVAGHPEAPYMTETPGSSWKYADHRWDLDRELVWGGQMTMANDPVHGQFLVGYQGLEDVEGGRDTDRFDLDGTMLALWHEMRHMGTINFGGGETGFNAIEGAIAGNPKNEHLDAINNDISNAEHMLNELEDYSLMQVYPWFRTIPAQRRPHYFSPDGTGLFDGGWMQERACFAWEWGLPAGAGSGGFDGYPPDQRNMAPMYLLTSHEEWGGKALETNTTVCVGGTSLAPKVPASGAPSSTETERCAVATWATNRPWMMQQMLLSILINQTTPFAPGMGMFMLPGLMPGPAPQPQQRPGPLAPLNTDKAVWNIIAHWGLGFPARTFPYCAGRKVPQ